MPGITIHIDARTNIEYASFYIKGLFEVYGRKHVKFAVAPFKVLPSGFEHFLAIIIKNNKETKNIIIDFTDSKHIDKVALKWSHVYGKINLKNEDIDLSKKIVAIGPSFGIKLYNLFETGYFGLFNFIKSYNYLKSKKQFLSSYKAQYKRPLLSSYNASTTKENFVFFLSTLWKQEPQTNMFRANFIKACLKLKDVNFEGGFVPRKNNDIFGFEVITTDKRLSTELYFIKLKQSEIVFNTPAVKNCHGWKLAEYLALGKAIISTPISRELPKELLDKQTVLLSDGSLENLEEKINTIFNDSVLKERLQKNALTYYHDYLAPSVVINRLITIMN